MQPPSATNKRLRSLSPSIQHRLNMYALAAGAAGVGMAALGPSAEAKIVYTPSNIPVTENGGLIPLDLNHDGIADFQFSNFSSSTHGLGERFLKIVAGQVSNQIWSANSKGHTCAAALPAGKTVGPKGKFQQDPANGLFLAYVGLDGTQGGTYFGPWNKVETAYLGLKFVVKGKTHFGWARIKFPAPGGWAWPTISGYAYETVQNKPIKTGQKKGQLPAASPTAEMIRNAPQGAARLGLLARGAAAITVWRRKEYPLRTSSTSPAHS